MAPHYEPHDEPMGEIHRAKRPLQRVPLPWLMLAIGEASMTVTLSGPARARLLIPLLAGATALSIAACGTSNNQNPTQHGTAASQPTSAPKPPPPPPPPPPPSVGKDHIEGLVRSVSGNTIQLTQRDRSAATVDFTPQTMVTELSSAALTDVQPGSCVDVRSAPQSASPGGAITAESVEISPAIAQRCPPPPGPAAAVYGTVDSVAGNAIKVNTTDLTGKTTHSTVTVTNTTTYTKHAVTNAQAVQNGKCMAAQGTKDGNVLRAATIDLEPCPPMGRPHRQFHLPWWLPHHHH
ncbi:MAG: hypothetical protein QOJ56_775 [Mycobacterium sp.]|jgi:hypothetical protein|nr:hypothetical protein [Mycobacterium sp.]